MALAVSAFPVFAWGQTSSETERRRQEIEQQLNLPHTPRPAPAPAPTPEVPDEPAAPVSAPGAPAGAAAPVSAPGAPAGAPAPPPSFIPEIHRLLLSTCRNCHAPGAAASSTRLVLQGSPRADYDTVRAFADLKQPRDSVLINKASGQMHGGGAIAPAGSRTYRRLLGWIAAGTPFEAPAPGAAPAPPPPPVAPRPRLARAPTTPLPAPPIGAPALPAPPAAAVPAPPAGTAAPVAGAAAAPAGPQAPDFATQIEPILTTACRACHNPQGMAGASRLHISGDPLVDHPAVLPFTNLATPAESPLVTKAAGGMHGGGPVLPADSEGHRTLLAWIAAGAPLTAAQPPAAGGGAEVSAAAPSAPALPPGPGSIAPPRPTAAPAAAPAPPPAPALPLGLHLDGRFDLNYEKRGLGRDTSFADGKSVLRSYHQFLFLSRSAPDDPIKFMVEVIGLQIWEGSYQHRFAKIPLVLTLRGGKLLVPFGNEPLFHQAYGGLAGFDQKILPVIWAQEGISAGLVFRRQRLSLSVDAYGVRGYSLRKADAILNLQNDFSAADDLQPGMGLRLGAAAGPLTAYYSLYFNPLGFDRRLFMQAADVGLWRPRGIPVLDRLTLGVGALRADVSGGGAGADYYHFGSYWQARFYVTDFLYLQYRQGLRTFNNRRGVILDETRLDADDASTHSLGVVARYRGLTCGVSYFRNSEKADEVDDDFFRVSVVYEF